MTRPVTAQDRERGAYLASLGDELSAYNLCHWDIDARGSYALAYEEKRRELEQRERQGMSNCFKVPYMSRAAASAASVARSLRNNGQGKANCKRATYKCDCGFWHWGHDTNKTARDWANKRKRFTKPQNGAAHFTRGKQTGGEV
jgi:hypothetical protein